MDVPDWSNSNCSLPAYFAGWAAFRAVNAR